jgi:hypothetical protein
VMSFLLLAGSSSGPRESMIAPAAPMIAISAPEPAAIVAPVEAPVPAPPVPTPLPQETKASQKPQPKLNGKAPQELPPQPKPEKKTVQKLAPADISAVMRAAKEKFAVCDSIGEGKVHISFVIAGSGRVSSATTSSTPTGEAWEKGLNDITNSFDKTGSQLESCVAGVVKGLVFPAFDDEQMSVSYTLAIGKK